VRRVAGPEGSHGGLIAGQSALYGELFVVHDVRRIGHGGEREGCRREAELRKWCGRVTTVAPFPLRRHRR
jgi:hypothetical protein